MSAVHQSRRPRASPLWQIVHHAWDDFLASYEKHHRRAMGPLRPNAIATVRAFLRCGDLAAGFTRFHLPPPPIRALAVHGSPSAKANSWQRWRQYAWTYRQ
jgi:hypothetical protein